MSVTKEVFGDMQTSITGGLAGAIAGQLSYRLGNTIEYAAGIQGGDLGNLALRFMVEAMSSAALYGVMVRIAPKGTQNTYFSYVYFLADPALTATTIEIANRLVDAVLGTSKIGFSKLSKPCTDCT